MKVIKTQTKLVVNYNQLNIRQTQTPFLSLLTAWYQVKNLDTMPSYFVSMMRRFLNENN